jgi:hypothetical protein
VPLEAREGVGPRDANKRAINSIGPGVIGTDEALPTAHLAVLRHQPSAAMTTDVQKDAYFTLAPAGDQDRYAAKLYSEYRSGVRELARMTQAQQQFAEQPFSLGMEAGRIVISGGIDRGLRCAAFVVAASIQPREEALEQAVPG